MMSRDALARGKVAQYGSPSAAMGPIRGTRAAEARPGLLFTSVLHPSHEDQMFWEEVFASLQVPASVQLTVLSDS